MILTSTTQLCRWEPIWRSPHLLRRTKLKLTNLDQGIWVLVVGVVVNSEDRFRWGSCGGGGGHGQGPTRHGKCVRWMTGRSRSQRNRGGKWRKRWETQCWRSRRAWPRGGAWSFRSCRATGEGSSRPLRRRAWRTRRSLDTVAKAEHPILLGLMIYVVGGQGGSHYRAQWFVVTALGPTDGHPLYSLAEKQNGV